jgi:hypothetical protein
MAGNLDKLEVTIHRQFRQKTKRLTLPFVGPTAGNRMLYATDVFASEQMEIVKQPERPNYRFGEKNRTRVQYTMCNAFAVVRMAELPDFTTDFAYEFGCTLSGVKGSINTFYPRTQVFARNGTGFVDTFNSPVMRRLAEVTAPGMVEPYAVSDYIYVSSQLAVSVPTADLPPGPAGPGVPEQIFMIVDYEVRLTAAGLQLPPG